MSTKATALLFRLCFLCLLSTILTVAQNPSSSSSSTTPPASIISRFQEYLRINTAHPNPNYYEAADFILSQARALSLESQTIEFVKNKPLILLKWPGKDPNLPSVLLNSHTDVVPVEVDKWVYPPFGAQIDSHGNIYARGSQVSTSIKLGSLSLSLSLCWFSLLGVGPWGVGIKIAAFHWRRPLSSFFDSWVPNHGGVRESISFLLFFFPLGSNQMGFLFLFSFSFLACFICWVWGVSIKIAAF